MEVDFHFGFRLAKTSTILSPHKHLKTSIIVVLEFFLTFLANFKFFEILCLLARFLS